MKKHLTKRCGWSLLVLGCWVFATEVALAQRGGGGGGGGGGFGGAAGRGATTGAYASPSTGIGTATFSSDQETRSIITVTDEKTYEYIKQIVASLDRPAPQVLIKVVFLEVTYTKGSDIGVEGQYTKNFGGGNAFTGLVNQAFGAMPGGIAGPNMGGIYSIMGADFQATLTAIERAGKTEILSRPSILARNNQPAIISLGQEVPLITGTRFDNFGNQINTFAYRNVGIILEVTPFITTDGKVEMIVAPTISALADRSQWVPISSGATNSSVSAPVINSRSASTVVVVPDAQTVVIGGLMQTENLESESKIPFLGDIPLLGHLFKRKIKDNTKRELMIFLTPRILNYPSQLAGMTERESANTQLVPKSFSEEQLNRIFDNAPAEDKQVPK